MLDSIIAKVVLGWVRHFVSMAGAWFVSQGLLTGAQSEQLTGALMVIVPLLFSAYDKYQAQAKERAALIARAEASTVPPLRKAA